MSESGKKQKRKKGKQPRKKDTRRVATILRRKEKLVEKWEASKSILIRREGKLIEVRKPKWRSNDK